MSTVFNIRNIKKPQMSRGTLIGGALALVVLLVAGYFGNMLYKKMTTTTVTAYFPEVLALYPGDKVQIMGVEVGAIDAIEAAVNLPFDQSLAREREIVMGEVGSDQSKALRYFFFAERESAKIPGIDTSNQPKVQQAAVIGAGAASGGSCGGRSAEMGSARADLPG